MDDCLVVNRRAVVAIEVERPWGRRCRGEHPEAEVERLRGRRRRSEQPGAQDERVHDDAIPALREATDFLLKLGQLADLQPQIIHDPINTGLPFVEHMNGVLQREKAGGGRIRVRRDLAL